MIRFECSFDDGSLYDVVASELLKQYDIPNVVFYIPASWKNYLQTKGLPPLSTSLAIDISSNFEIGSHGIMHQLLTRIPMSEANDEIVGSRKMLQNLFGQPIDKFCYPRGYANADIAALVAKAGYTEARTTLVGSLEKPKDPFLKQTTLHVGYDRKEYGTDWYTYGLQKLFEAVEKSAKGEEVVYHFWGHSHEIQQLDQWDRFESFLKVISEYIQYETTHS